MEIANTNDMAETTCDRIGLVCRTKVELYYFLSSEGKLPHFISPHGSCHYRSV